MKRFCLTLIALLLVAPLTAGAVSNYQSSSSSDGGVVLRLSDPPGSIYSPGEEVEFSFQTREDGYVIVFNIDTEGYVSLLYPGDGKISAKSRAGETYRIPENPGVTIRVEGETGIEFVFALTIPHRQHVDTDELEYLAGADQMPRDQRYRRGRRPNICSA